MDLYNEKLDSLKNWTPGLILSVIIMCLIQKIAPLSFHYTDELLVKSTFFAGMINFVAFTCLITLIVGLIRYLIRKDYKTFWREFIGILFLTIFLFAAEFVLLSRVDVPLLTSLKEESVTMTSIPFLYLIYIPLIIYGITFIEVLIRLIIKKEVTAKNVFVVFFSLVLIFLFVCIYFYVCFESAYLFTQARSI